MTHLKSMLKTSLYCTDVKLEAKEIYSKGVQRRGASTKK